LKQDYPWLVFPGSSGVEPDGPLEVKGSGFSYGGNVGLTLNLTEHQRVAVTYRSAMTAHPTGDLTLDNITPTAAFLGATSRSDMSTRIAYPSVVALGYGIALTDSIRIEVDGEWVQFSRFKDLTFGVGNNAFLLPTTTIPQNWRDTFTVGIGGDWRFSPNWVVRAGYQFYQSPVPDSTFSPTIPDADQNVITVGLGYKYKHHSLEGAYGLDFYNTRNITTAQNPAYNGKYEVTVHLFSLSYRYSF
jgi:long-chain fatty acid transport protein